MHTPTKSLHRGWYFLLCYIGYSAITIDYVIRTFIKPQLLDFCHLTTTDMTGYYQIVFLGNIIGLLIFGCLVDALSYRTCFIWAFIAQILGVIKLTLITPIMTTPIIAHHFTTGMFLTGLGEGGVFAIIHPLIALVYNDSIYGKTKVMNYLHTNWILLFTLGAIGMKLLMVYDLNWRFNLYAMLLFPCLYLIGALVLPLPKQSFAHSIPLSSRIKSTLRPGFLLLFFCMIFSITIAFGPQTWIRYEMDTHFHLNVLFFLIFFNLVQIIFRCLGGSLAQRISPPGLLCMASLLSALSLYLLSFNHATGMSLFAAGLFAISISWYWPTLIAIVIDRYPLSGGFGMALMNCSGFLAMFIIVPHIVKLPVDEGINKAFLSLSWYSILTFILLGAVYVFFRSQGGYKVLSSAERSV